MKTFGLLAVGLGVVFAIGLAEAAVPAGPASAPATLPGKQMTLDLIGNVQLKLVQIPAGKFIMGSPANEAERIRDEEQHEVTISKPFYMGITLVTDDQFVAFALDSGYQSDAEKDGFSPGMVIRGGQLDRGVGDNVPGCSWRNPSFDQAGDHPVVQMSWNDATAFCQWLSKKSGKKVALPTEAQWEYASRAGVKTAFPWGDDPDKGKGWANCADQSWLKVFPDEPAGMFFNWDDGFVYTSPVGSFKSNAFGITDVTGNVFQWCQDYYGPYEKGPVTDPTGPATGQQHITRGGSWNNEPRACRLAFRYRQDPKHRNVDYGFRVVVADGE